MLGSPMTTTLVVDIILPVELAHSLQTWGSFSSQVNLCNPLDIQCSCMVNMKYRLDSG